MHAYDRCCRKPSVHAVRYTVINTASQDINIKSDCTGCGNRLSYVMYIDRDVANMSSTSAYCNKTFGKKGSCNNYPSILSCYQIT